MNSTSPRSHATPGMRPGRCRVPLSLLLALAAAHGWAATVAPADRPAAVWHDLSAWPIEGQGWTDTKSRYDRLPAKAENVVRGPVWSLGMNSAGLQLRFVTDATEISARWTVRNATRMALPHMPATGVSGLDLYWRDAGEWKWIGAGRPGAHPTTEAPLVKGLAPGRSREFLLYLPLYNGTESIALGLPPGTRLDPAPARQPVRRPIVIYGTSITQGGCASRPGMAYPAIVSRMLDWPTINLGFSGNGKTEPEMAALLAELDPAAYVIDSLPNLDVAQVAERMPPFVVALRAAHPDTPIVLVENVSYADAGTVESRRAKVAGANAHLRGLCDRLRAAGDRHLHYVPAFLLLGGDGEDTVDGTHATDLGFQRMAQGMAPILREALRQAGHSLEDEPGFVSVFDGRTLSGWTTHDAFSTARKERPGSRWSVEDGALTGTYESPAVGGFLWLDRAFSDFVLRLEVRMDYPIDSGVFLRVGPTGRSHQVMLDYQPGGEIGAVYVPFEKSVLRNPEGIRAFRKGDWNDMEIRIEGDPARIRAWLNGYLITDYKHTDESTRKVPRSGGIALQCHPYFGKQIPVPLGNKVRFRHLRIKELPAP